MPVLEGYGLGELYIFNQLVMKALKVYGVLILDVPEEFDYLVDALRMAQRKQSRSLDTYKQLSILQVRAVYVEYLYVDFKGKLAFLGLDEIFTDSLGLGDAERAGANLDFGVKWIAEHFHTQVFNASFQPLVLLTNKVLILEDAHLDLAKVGEELKLELIGVLGNELSYLLTFPLRKVFIVLFHFVMSLRN